jgi:hypothetical protein
MTVIVLPILEKPTIVTMFPSHDDPRADRLRKPLVPL